MDLAHKTRYSPPKIKDTPLNPRALGFISVLNDTIAMPTQVTCILVDPPHAQIPISIHLIIATVLLIIAPRVLE